MSEPSLEARTIVLGLGFEDGGHAVLKTVRVWISRSFRMLSLYASSFQFVASPNIFHNIKLTRNSNLLFSETIPGL